MVNSLILNGSMRFDQVKVGLSAYHSSLNEVYGLDQWRFSAALHGTAGFDVQQVSDAPLGFSNSMKITVTSAKGSTPVDDFDHIEHAMEGQKIVPYQPGSNASAFYAMQFWAKASIAGDYSVNLMEGRSNSTSIVKKYNLSTALTWQPITLKFAAPTIGTWTLDNQFGFKALWDLGAGSNFVTSTLDTWQTGAKWRAAGAIGLTEHAGATLQLTGVQLDPIASLCSEVPAYRHHDYWDELASLENYYWKTFPQGTPVGNAGGYNGAIAYLGQLTGAGAGSGVYLPNPRTMGAFLDPQSGTTNASYTFYNPVSNNGLWYNASRAHDSGTPVPWTPGSNGAFIQNGQITGDIAQDIYFLHATVNARLGRS